MVLHDTEPLADSPGFSPHLLSPDYTRLPESSPGAEVQIFEGTYDGKPAYYFTASGVELAIALTRELTNEGDQEYTYYFHHDGVPFGEVDVHLDGDTVVYFGEGVSEEVNLEDEEAAEAAGERLLLSMLLLPLALREDFPQAHLIDDGYGDIYPI